MRPEFENMNEEKLINSVKHWLDKTIIGHNFCPFAKKEFVNETIHYEVVNDANREEQLMALTHEFTRLDEQHDIATTLLLLPIGLESFFDYLDFLDIANNLLAEVGYEGTYQLASFHPDYCFADAQQDDSSNYTNRSPVPIIHILREARLEKVLESYPEPEKIPEQNIILTEKLGSELFEEILEECRREQE